MVLLNMLLELHMLIAVMLMSASNAFAEAIVNLNFTQGLLIVISNVTDNNTISNVYWQPTGEEKATCVGYFRGKTGQCYGYCHNCDSGLLKREAYEQYIQTFGLYGVVYVDEADDDKYATSVLPQRADGVNINKHNPPEIKGCYGYYRKKTNSCWGVCVEC